MKRFAIRRLLTIMCTTGAITLSSQIISSNAIAAGFQLYEQSASNVANYHAGYAAAVDDAGTIFYNPAGITRFKNQQAVFGLVVIPTSIKFRGTVGVNTILAGLPQTATAQGGTFAELPHLAYVAPINDWIGFGLTIAAPFGLKTDYGRQSVVRYNSTYTSVVVYDISPSLALRFNQLSIGAGFNVQPMRGEFDLQAGNGLPFLDTPSSNRASDTGYGYMLGAIYEFTPEARVGASYHSQVVHKLTGTSKFVGPIALAVNSAFHMPLGQITSDHARVGVTLPPYTALSGYYHFCPQIALMGSIIYTQWSTFKTLSLQNIAGVGLVSTPFGLLPGPRNDLIINVPENFKNVWNASLGADYFVTERLTLRGGIGFDQSPVKNRYRNIQLPDNDRYIVAMGGRFKATRCLTLDLGYMHLFVNQVRVNPPPLQIGLETVTMNGKAQGGADVYGGQITWDFL